MGNEFISEEQSIGLLWAYHINQGTAAPLEIKNWLNVQETEGFSWVHVQSDSPDTEAMLVNAGVPENVVEGLCVSETRPGAMQMSDGMLIYLRGINRNPQADPDDMVSVRIWLWSKGIITARRKGRRLMSMQDAKKDIDNGIIPENQVDLMICLIRRIAERINETVDLLDEELTEFEALERTDAQDRVKLTMVRRQAAALRRYLAPQRDALDAVYRFNKSLNNDQTFELRELTDRMTRYVEDLDLAKERSMVLQDEMRNRIAEQQGMRMYVLSLVTAVFLPLSFLTGVFGMNVAGLPGTEDSDAFQLLAMSMGGIAVIIFIFMLWKKWF